MLHLQVWTLRNIRNAIGLLLGTAVGIHEIFLIPAPRTEALLFSLACLAGTFALWQDEKKR